MKIFSNIFCFEFFIKIRDKTEKIIAIILFQSLISIAIVAIDHLFARERHADAIPFDDMPDNLRMEIPLLKDGSDRLQIFFFGHQHHALLRLGEKKLVGGHSRLARWDAIQIELPITAAAP